MILYISHTIMHKYVYIVIPYIDMCMCGLLYFGDRGKPPHILQTFAYFFQMYFGEASVCLEDTVYDIRIDTSID